MDSNLYLMENSLLGIFDEMPCTIVQGISSKMVRREFSIFIIFSDTYTCSYVAYQV